jgi:hypothetical protein
MSDVLLQPTAEQTESWGKAAGERELVEWITQLADLAAGVVSKQSTPITITLRKPVTYGSRTIDKITVRPVKGKHMRALRASDNPMAQTLLMASKLSGEVSEVIDELEGSDLHDVLEAVNAFFFAIQ